MNDDVREIVARAMTGYRVEVNKQGLVRDAPIHILDANAISDTILAALADKGRGLYDINAEVKVDRERFERQRNVTEAAYEWVNSPLGDGVEIERVEKRLVSLVDALQPGDLDPLPERGE